MKKRNTIIIMGLVLICVFFIGFARYIDFPVLHRGVPLALQSFTDDMDLTLGNPRYYRLSSFIDSEWLWKTSLSEQDMSLLADKLKMRPILSDQIEDQFFNMPPYWWQPEISDQVRVIVTTNFPMGGRGSDGWHALAIWNPEDEVLYMWIKDNF